MSRRSGFTLIELLVVIAIIAILAAMLFPVFARARESARKIQCLSNVKNIAMAFQMYFTDYDRFPPSEHNQAALAFFASGPGIPTQGDPTCSYLAANKSNPYLRWAVILDEYVKNRDVWRCPSAKLVTGAFWIIPGTNYLQSLQTNEGLWGPSSPWGLGPCELAFPSGWGGAVTDSFMQGSPIEFSGSTVTGAFEQTIGCVVGGFLPGDSNMDLKVSQIPDASWWAVCADAGGTGQPPELAKPNEAAWPDICQAGTGPNCYGVNSWQPSESEAQNWYRDPTIRKKYTRHLGGSNLGFADGHAAWMPADEIWTQSPGAHFVNYDAWDLIWYPDRGKLRGFPCPICDY
ncbi:MAG: DUF1559 domain-containing protein [Armatimonadota bacterium]|jgi:prepilin-type N-terminal cleavage/methylation domain-containing protein/prepilin-type processing-associated H-X9-DG protein